MYLSWLPTYRYGRRRQYSDNPDRRDRLASVLSVWPSELVAFSLRSGGHCTRSTSIHTCLHCHWTIPSLKADRLSQRHLRAPALSTRDQGQILHWHLSLGDLPGRPHTHVWQSRMPE